MTSTVFDDIIMARGVIAVIMYPQCILLIENDSDRAKMELLYNNSCLLVKKRINELVSHEQDRKDLYQTTWVKAIDKMDVLREMDYPRQQNYVVTTARHLAINYNRDKKHNPTVSFDEWELTGPVDDGVEEELLRIEAADDLWKVWKELSERARYILEARYILDKSVEEIAKDLHVKVDSVYVFLSRARMEARGLIEAKRAAATK